MSASGPLVSLFFATKYINMFLIFENIVHKAFPMNFYLYRRKKWLSEKKAASLHPWDIWIYTQKKKFSQYLCFLIKSTILHISLSIFFT